MQNQYLPEISNNLITDSLRYLNHQLPTTVSILQNRCKNIPGHLQSSQMIRKIYALNKKLIVGQFEKLCQQITPIYIQNKVKLHKNFKQTIKIVNHKVFDQYPYHGQFYSKSLLNASLNDKNYANQQDAFYAFLQTIARAHYDNFQLGKSQLSSMTMTKTADNHQLRIPQKFNQIIINTIKTTISKKSQNHNQSEQNAQKMRNTLINNIFMGVDVQKSKDKPQLSDEGGKKQKQGQYKATAMDKVQRMTGFLIQMANQKYKAYSAQKKKKNSENEKENNHDNEYQDKVNMLVMAIQGDSLNKDKIKVGSSSKRQNIQSKQLQNQENQKAIEDLFGLEGSNNISYYQTHMIAHLTNLILFHQTQFRIQNVRYSPYLQTLKNTIENEILQLRKEETEFNKIMANLPFLPKLQGFEKTESKTKTVVEPNVQKDKCMSNPFRFIANKINEKRREHSPSIKVRHLNSDPTEKYYPQLLTNLEQYCRYLKKLSHSHTFEGGMIPKIVTQIAEGVEEKLGFSHHQNQYHQIQSWIIIIILLYVSLDKNKKQGNCFSPLTRRTMIKILKKIFKPTTSKYHQIPTFRNWPVVLKYLQNHRPEVLALKNKSSVCQNAQKTLDYLIKNIDRPELVGESLAGIFTGGLQKFRKQLPKMKLVCLSNGGKQQNGPRCKVVNLFISGFLSEDTDKLDEWADLVDLMPEQEIYSLIWQSDTIKNLVWFLLKSTKQILFAPNITEQLKRKYSDNPFNPAFAVSQITGRILAQLVLKLFPDRFVNIIGYSLGTQVIKQFMFRMVETKRLNNINNVYLMGGVSDARSLTDIISHSSVPLSVYNCYTNHDSVLRHLLALCKPEITAIGLHDLPAIPGHNIVNIDCTKFIGGHLAFRSNLDVMGQVLEMSLG